MNSPSNCPYTKIKQSQLGQIVGNFITSIKNNINQITGNEPFTYKWARDYLGLKNDKKENDKKYTNLSMEQIVTYLDSEDYEEYLEIMRSIENEISIYVFHKILLEMQTLNTNSIDFSQYKDGVEHFFSIPQDLIDDLSHIANKILKHLYDDINNGDDTEQIHQTLRAYLEKNNQTEISDRLKGLLFDDGIIKTVNTVFSGVHSFVEAHGEYDRSEVENFIKNDEQFWSQIGLINIPLIYMEKAKKEGAWYAGYSIEENKTTFHYTQRKFKKIVKKYKDKMPIWVTKGTYRGCPLLFTKTNIQGDQVNGIIAWQKIIYKLILDRIDAYKQYNREKEKAD